MKLEKIRKQIDIIDEKILSLLKNRFELVWQIRELKQAHKLPVEDKNREEEVLTTFIRKGEMLKLSKFFVRQLFNLISNESKRIQIK